MVKNNLLVVGFGHMGQPMARFAQQAGFRVTVLLKPGSKDIPAAINRGFEVITKLPAKGTEEEGQFAVIILAVKPQNLHELSDDFRSYLSHSVPQTVVVSLLAGTKLATIRTIFTHCHILRIMPNLTITAGSSCVAGVAQHGFIINDFPLLERLLSLCGHFQLVDNEDQLDAMTAIVGSGPAYIAKFISIFADSVATLGVPAATAELAMKMITESTAHYLLQGGGEIADFIKAVTSKGGVTEAGLLALNTAEFREKIVQCVQFTYKKAKELQNS